MALQTYIWDNQSDKSAGGDTSGDIDAGGFANADTYETYVGYYNWMLAQKAKEDAELQKPIRASRHPSWRTCLASGPFLPLPEPLAARASLPITQPVRL